MSPNEFQLRSALRDGEGETVDPATVIARARGLQQASHDRRVRYGSVAAVVAVVGGIGVVGGIALQGGAGTTKSGPQAYRADSGAGKAAAAPAGPGGGDIAPGPMADARAVRCPGTPPRLALPGGGGTAQFGAHDPLFRGPVEAVKICAYPPGGAPTAGPPSSTEVTGQNATDLVTSLNAAAVTRPPVDCPRQGAAGARTLVLIALSSARQAIPAVVVTLSCPSLATNGTAIRYAWTPPPALLSRLPQIGATAPSGQVSASPVRS